MSKKNLLLAGFVLSALAGVASIRSLATAQEVTREDACRNRVHYELTTAFDEYRAHLFGGIGAIEGSDIIPRTGGSVDREVTGIFETRGRLTSELVEPIVESTRVLRCRARAICAVMRESFRVPESEGIKDIVITNLGCEDIEGSTFSECRITADAPIEAGLQTTELSLLRECHALVLESLAMEDAALRLAVGYDSGYRSLLQFSGMTSWMLQDLPNHAIPEMTKTINLLGKLHQIPCFTGQCDAPNVDALAP